MQNTPKMPTNRVPVSVGVPFNLLPSIDETANKEGISRSEFFLQAAIEKMEKINEK